MAQRDLFPHGPFTLTAQFHFTATMDGEKFEGTAEVDLPAGKIPTQEEMAHMVALVRPQLPADARFLTRQEFADAQASERTGVKCSLPVSSEPFSIEAFGNG